MSHQSQMFFCWNNFELDKAIQGSVLSMYAAKTMSCLIFKVTLLQISSKFILIDEAFT